MARMIAARPAPFSIALVPLNLARTSRGFRFGIIALLVLGVFSALSLFSPYDPYGLYIVPPSQAPSQDHWFGTTALGQDVFWITTFAVRNSLFIGSVAVLLGRSIGVMLGLISGYLGGPVDRILSALSDTFIVIPRLPLLMLVAFIIKDQLSLIALGLLIGSLDWAWPSKRYRAQILALREEGFTQTAIFSGLGSVRVVFREHFPFILPFLLADAVSGFLFAIGVEVTLAVLGLSDVQTPTIGTVIYWANYYQAFLLRQWWWLAAPISAAVLLVVALYYTSASLSEYLDPRTRLSRQSRRAVSA